MFVGHYSPSFVVKSFEKSIARGVEIKSSDLDCGITFPWLSRWNA